MCHWLGYHLNHDTTKHGFSGVVKESTGDWNGALLFSVMRLGSVCMRVMDVHVYGVDLVSIIFRSALAHAHRPYLRLPVLGATSYNSLSHLDKVNSALYIAQVVNPVLLPFHPQESDLLSSRTTHIRAWVLRYNVLFVVYNNNCPGQQDPQISYHSTRMGHDEAEPSRVCHNHCRIATTGARCLEQYRRMTFGT